MKYFRSSSDVRARVLAGATAVALAMAAKTFAAGDVPAAAFRAPKLDPAAEARVMALNCARLSPDDVRALAAAPAPRVIQLHGGVPIVYLLMVSFGRFLVGMGYPESSIRDPVSGDWSYSPYMDTKQLAGLVAWQYERDGMRPMLIGHSQGGLAVVKVLKDLAGRGGNTLQVWNPYTWAYEDRTSIVDPLTGEARPVVGSSVAYGSAVGAGGWALILPREWESLDTLRKIPDTASEFTGFFVGNDLIAMSFAGNPLDVPYEASGKAAVRNVVLPSTYNHITVPDADDLPEDPKVKSWVDAFVPGTDADTSSLPLSAQLHVMYAADVWYSVKKHWCLEAQNLIRHTSKSDARSAPKPAPEKKPEAAPDTIAAPKPDAPPPPGSGAAPAERPGNGPMTPQPVPPSAP